MLFVHDLPAQLWVLYGRSAPPPFRQTVYFEIAKMLVHPFLPVPMGCPVFDLRILEDVFEDTIEHTIRYSDFGTSYLRQILEIQLPQGKHPNSKLLGRLRAFRT